MKKAVVSSKSFLSKKSILHPYLPYYPLYMICSYHDFSVDAHL